MSYNVDSSEIIEQENFHLDAETVKKLKLLDYDGELDLPECTFLDQLDDRYDVTTKDNGDVYFDKGQFWWYGEGSGRRFDVLEKELLPKFKGKAKILFTWEGGDSHSALVVEDGKVREGKVEIIIK